MAEHNGTWWIWKVFWILLVILLTLVKAGYIVQVFMHVKYEKKAMKYALYLPSLILIPYLTFILLTEGSYLFS